MKGKGKMGLGMHGTKGNTSQPGKYHTDMPKRGTALGKDGKAVAPRTGKLSKQGKMLTG